MKMMSAFLGVCAVAAVVALGATCGSSSKAPPTIQCVLNSDCHDPGLQCAQGFCVKMCNASSDCPTGERCISLTAADVGAAGGANGAAGSSGAAGDTGAAGAGGASVAAPYNYCQAPEKRTCALNSDCSPLFCGADLQCRNQCKEDRDCPLGLSGPQKCTTTSKLCVDPVLDAKTYDPTTNEIVADSGKGGSGVSAGMGGKSGGGGGKSGSSCPTPQTAFRNVAQGDTNPNFVAGVGVRLADRTLIFSAYTGPPVAVGGAGGTSAGEGAGGAGGAATANVIFVQAFDADTGVAMGAAVPLFEAKPGTNFYLHNAAVSPSGEIVLLHGTGPVNANNTTLYATFLTTTAAAGTAGVQVEHTVTIESSQFGDVGVFWSAANQQYVLYWKYITTTWFLRIKRFLPGGTPAGGDTNAIATPTGLNGTEHSFGVGASGMLFATAYRDSATGQPYLTILGPDGNQVGGFTKLSSTGISPWIQVGGTAVGFVVLFQSGSTAYETFVPKTADGLDIKGATGAGGAAGGGAGGAGGAAAASPWTTFNIPSTATSAAESFSIGDEAGAGGVGTVYLEQNGASFLYVTADGSKHFAIGSVISSSMGTQVAITNHHGSFGISLYEGMKHATQVVASGCTP